METKYRHRYLLQKISSDLIEKTNNTYFVESGVKQGSASVVMAKYLGVKGYLFDTWTNFPHFSEFDAFTSRRRMRLKKRVRGGKNTYKECVKNLSENGVFDLCTMIKGDICVTIPEFIKNEGENLSICFIHSDSDLYKPTKVTLKNLWPYLMDGGAILVHDYKTKQWPGVEKSVNEFLKNKKVLFCSFGKKITFSCLIMKDKNNRFQNRFKSFCKNIKLEFSDDS